ncbi:MAG: efflux RND transporter periplasmic adaptor subunit [Pyrinomonadaceae bacterium]
MQLSKYRNHFALFFILLLFVAVFVSACSRSNAESAKAEAKPTPVDVSTVVAIRRDLTRYIEASGSLAAQEQTIVSPLIAGRVLSVAVDLGSVVSKGQPLVILDPADTKLKVDQAIAQAEQARAAAQQAEQRIGLRPGQKFDPALVPDVKEARAAFVLAEKEIARYDRLIETGDVSRSIYDQQKAQHDQMYERYQAALNDSKQNYQGARSARAAAESADSAVTQLKKNLSDLTIRAPLSGYVAERQANVGQYLATSSQVATIVVINPLRMRIEIPEQSIQEIKTGQAVQIKVSSFGDRNFIGHVVRISPNLNTTSRTLIVEAEVDNNEGLLKPGQFATVLLARQKIEPAILIPQGTIITDPSTNTSRVYVVKDGHVQERLVKLGQKEGDLQEVQNGVAVDEQVATSNLDKLKDGVPVRQ